jgi:hypothetical protein
MRVPRFRVLTWLGVAPANKDELSNLHYALQMKIISFVNMSYMTLVRYCFAAFVCEEVVPGTSALLISPSMDCWTSEHRAALVAASIGMLVYVIGFPVVVATTLMRVHRAQLHSDPPMLRKFGDLYALYEPHGFGYEMMSILRRGGFGAIGVFSASPPMQCFAAQLLLILQFSAQVKMNPYLDPNLDIVQTVLTLILLLISCSGMLFSASPENVDFAPGQEESLALDRLGLLTYLIIVLGSALCAALLANEVFEIICGWYLNRVGFLGDASADPRRGREALAFSKTALAHAEVPPGTQQSAQKSAGLPRQPSFVLRSARRLSSRFRGSYDASQSQADKEIGCADTKLFYNVNLLRFRRTMQRLDSSRRSSCAKLS